MRLADACELLAIRTDTSREDAQRAYRKLALRHHPDRCPNDPSATSRFQTVGEAWERVQQFHDNPRRWGLHADPPEPQAESAAAQATDFAGGRATSFDDLFERWFGGRTTWGEGDFAPPAPRGFTKLPPKVPHCSPLVGWSVVFGRTQGRQRLVGRPGYGAQVR